MNIEQHRQLGQDENTAPKILAELAKNKDYQVRKTVAANPNTPTATLLIMCFEFPREVINNPIIPLLILENPDCLKCKLTLDFNQIKRLTDLEIKRLNFKKEQGKNYLMKKYGKRSRLHLTDRQLLDFLIYLRSLSVNDLPPITEERSQQSSEVPWDEIPF